MSQGWSRHGPTGRSSASTGRNSLAKLALQMSCWGRILHAYLRVNLLTGYALLKQLHHHSEQVSDSGEGHFLPRGRGEEEQRNESHELLVAWSGAQPTEEKTRDVRSNCRRIIMESLAHLGVPKSGSARGWLKGEILMLCTLLISGLYHHQIGTLTPAPQNNLHRQTRSICSSCLLHICCRSCLHFLSSNVERQQCSGCIL